MIKNILLWLYHSDGGVPWTGFVHSCREVCSRKRNLYYRADVQHCLCTNMEYGPKYEEFMVKELAGNLQKQPAVI